MANYPEILDSFTPKVDNTNDVMAVDVNELQTAISALETKVGIDESEDTTSLDYKIAQLQSGKQDNLGFTPENSANKETSALDTSTTKYPCNNVVKTAVDAKLSNITNESIGDLSDVDLTGLANDKILKYNSTSQKFEAADVSISGSTITDLPVATEVEADDVFVIVKDDSGITKQISFSDIKKSERVSRGTSVASITPDISSFDIYELTAQADNFTLNLPSKDIKGSLITIRIKATADKTLTINGSYKALNTLPTALANGKMYEFIINQFNTGANKEYWLSGMEI